jgi:glycosyltransferase involved in cell wall biosynthesis
LAVAVVVATRDRPAQLAALRESLRGQAEQVVVVEDVDGRGPSWARNVGWRSCDASFVAFVDDDCVASPGWLAALVAEAGEGVVVQGRVEPARPMQPFSRSLVVRDGPGPWFQTANVLYPRSVLEAVGGFDEEAFPYVGEDTDLAWRARAAGASFAFARGAVVWHDVAALGPLGALRFTGRWTESIRLFARHPELRRAALTKRVFWKGSHYLLLRALLTLVLPRRLWGLAAWLWMPYALHLVDRWREEGGGPALAPWLVLHDLVEVGAVARGAVRYRTLVL